MILEFLYRRQIYKTTKVRIGKAVLNAIVADTLVKKIIGLMFRDGLPKNTCMLFLFDHASNQGIWMRNMKFAIDIIWLDGGKGITGMVKNARPATGVFDFKTYYPSRPSKYVIELPAGFLSRNRITGQSKVDLRI
ncbi:MAG: DUF192 domain-containing protein [Candidatus Micrarchaeota archaeon]|nr:DUF192 domain-containing protein [Candidatus Micrarchaeota archaeon]